MTGDREAGIWFLVFGIREWYEEVVSDLGGWNLQPGSRYLGFGVKGKTTVQRFMH